MHRLSNVLNFDYIQFISCRIDICCSIYQHNTLVWYCTIHFFFSDINFFTSGYVITSRMGSHHHLFVLCPSETTISARHTHTVSTNKKVLLRDRKRGTARIVVSPFVSEGGGGVEGKGRDGTPVRPAAGVGEKVYPNQACSWGGGRGSVPQSGLQPEVIERTPVLCPGVPSLPSPPLPSLVDKQTENVTFLHTSYAEGNNWGTGKGVRKEDEIISEKHKNVKIAP